MDNKTQQVHNLALAAYSPVVATETIDKKGWVNYGDNNDYNVYLNDLYDTAPVHGVVLSRVISMIIGKGLSSTDAATQSKIEALEINENALHQIGNDLGMYGGFYIEIINTLDATDIAKMNCLPFENMRVQVSEEGEFEGAWYSNNWADTRKKANTPKFIPKYNGIQSEGGKGVVYVTVPKSKKKAYPKPPYNSGLTWIEVDRQIGLFHVNNLMNGLFPSFIVNLFNGETDPQTQQMIKSKWERELTGAGAASKFLMSFNEADRKGVEVTTFPISDADKQYQFLSDKATEHVLIAHGITTPLLFGVRTATGFGSNSEEMQVGLRIFISQVIEPFQRIITKCFEEYLGGANTISIVPNTPIEVMDAQNQNADATQAENVAAQALNGAQITSLVDIIMQAAGNAIPIASAKAVVAAGFPMLTPIQIDNIFKDIVPGTVPQAAVLRKTIELAIEKKKCSSDHISDEDGKAWLKHLENKAEVVDLDEWELVEYSEAGTHEDEARELAKYETLSLAADQYANGDLKSKHGDSGLYKLRYAYSQNLSENTREFCREMVRGSQAGLVFRYEDIKAMSRDETVNPQFGPAGSNTYDIFEWKGGAFCHHKWVRLVYFRKREKGKFLPNDGLKNDKRVGNVPYVPQKGVEGVAPIDTPTRGSLKYA